MGKYRKFIVGVLTAGLIAAQNVIEMSDTARGWVTVALAVLGAVGVYAVENEPMPIKPANSEGSRHRWPSQP